MAQQTPPSTLGRGYVPTQEEQRVLSECRRNSVIRGIITGGVGLGFAHWVMSRRGRPGPSRLVAVAYYLGFSSVGFYGGVISYQPKCVEKLLEIPNSPMADELRMFMERAKNARPPQGASADTRPLQYQQQRHQQQMREAQLRSQDGDPYSHSQQPPDEGLHDDGGVSSSSAPTGYGSGYGLDQPQSMPSYSPYDSRHRSSGGGGGSGVAGYAPPAERTRGPSDPAAERVRDHVPDSFAPDGLPTWDSGASAARRGEAGDEMFGGQDERWDAEAQQQPLQQQSYAELRDAHRREVQPVRERPAWARRAAEREQTEPQQQQQYQQYPASPPGEQGQHDPYASRSRMRYSKYGDQLEDDEGTR